MVRVSVSIPDPDAAGDRAQAPRLVEIQADLPFGDYGLALGTYYIGYELRILVRGKVAFVQPIAATRLDIAAPWANRTREIAHVVAKGVQETKVGTGYAHVDGKLVEFKTSYAAPKAVTERHVKTVTDDGIRRQVASVAPQAISPLSDIEQPEKRVVYFATTRCDSGQRDRGLERFLAVTGPVSYGTCLVNIPVSKYHTAGLIEERKRFYEPNDPNQFFMIDAITPLLKADFVASLGNDDVFLFVHGYANSLSDAIFRVAELKHDLNFQAKPLVFSWPSAGGVSDYEADEERNDESVPGLAEVLETLFRNKQGRRIHVLAHSMGNRVLLNAVQALVADNRLAADEILFDRVALCAPTSPPTNSDRCARRCGSMPAR